MSGLGAPPAFAPDGAPPPLRSAWVPVGQVLLACTVPAKVQFNSILGRDKGGLKERLRMPKFLDTKFPAQQLRELAATDVPAEFRAARAWLDQRAELNLEFGEPPQTATQEFLARSATVAGAGVGMLTGFLVGGPVGSTIGSIGGVLAWDVIRHRRNGGYLLGSVLELRRVTGERCWRRDDPVSMLDPGTRRDATKRVVLGLSEQRTRELAASLGLANTGQLGPVQASVNARLTRTVTISEVHERADTIALDNIAGTRPRRFAVWSTEDRLTVEGLGPVDENGVAVAGDLGWEARETFLLTTSEAVATTAG